jgi:SH3 domain protein
MGLEHSRPRFAVLVLWLLPALPVWPQETMYVTDIVQLGLHRAADTSDEAFRNLVSGTPLTVLERTSNFARVRTPDGEEGWVRSFYLVEETPARARVEELEARIDTLEQELRAANAGREAAAAEAGNVAAGMALELETEAAQRARLAELELENQAYFERFQQYRGMLPWPWVAGAVMLALGAGGLAGYWWLDAAIRRRYGGFKLH